MNIPTTIIPMHASELNKRPIEWGEPVIVLSRGNAQSIAEALETMPPAGASELIRKNFGGIAVRSTMRQNLGVPDQGLIHRGQRFECLTQGTVVVKFYNPDHVPNPKVYLRLWKNPENVPQAIPGSFEATDDGDKTLLMENMLYLKACGDLAAEVALLPKRMDRHSDYEHEKHDENCALCRILVLSRSRGDLAGDAPTLLEGAKRFFGPVERVGDPQSSAMEDNRKRAFARLTSAENLGKIQEALMRCQDHFDQIDSLNAAVKGLAESMRSPMADLCRDALSFFSFNSEEFIECEECHKKAGSPPLCNDCLRRRDEFYATQRENPPIHW